jgi:ribosomal protein S18 acetylase RimI-like enzyme
MISIRRAGLADREVLADFQQKMALETESITLNRDTLLKGLTALLNDPAKGFYTVAERGGEAIACYMITYEWSDWRNGVVWWLQSLYVKPECRGEGVFRSMYDDLIKKVRSDESVAGLRLYVDKTNQKAMQVYGSLGMNGEHYTMYEWMK